MRIARASRRFLTRVASTTSPTIDGMASVETYSVSDFTFSPTSHKASGGPWNLDGELATAGLGRRLRGRVHRRLFTAFARGPPEVKWTSAAKVKSRSCCALFFPS